MTPATALEAVTHLPRYDRVNSWAVRGRFCTPNINVATPSLDRALTKRMKARQRDPDKDRETVVMAVDVRNAMGIHHRLRYRTLRYVVRHFVRLGNLSVAKLPIIVRYRGLKIIWNGHHRVEAAKLLGRKLWCRVIDLDGARA